ncbi:pyridoxamine 5'-phosphate oxidase family protein [Plantactinospora alkalitolerans]
MPVTNPWLAGPDGPLATPVRYFHLGFAILFTASAASPKVRNIAADPRVSIGVFAPLVGQASSRGAQLFGRARILTAEHPDFGHYWPAHSRPLPRPVTPVDRDEVSGSSRSSVSLAVPPAERSRCCVNAVSSTPCRSAERTRGSRGSSCSAVMPGSHHDDSQASPPNRVVGLAA